MGMPNRDINVLKRHALSNENLIKEMKTDAGKKYLKAVEEYERAAGGKKKLDEADKILADARKMYDKRISEAQKAAQRLIEEAQERIAAGVAANEIKAQELTEATIDLNVQRKDLAMKVHELDNAVAAVKRREQAANERDSALNGREFEVARREREVSAREDAAARFSEWASQRPA